MTWIYSILVPAIPFETLSQLQESSDTNDAPDYFQSVEVENSEIIEEIIHSPIEENGTQIYSNNELNDLDEIPDMDDFENENLLLTEDPVNQMILLCFIFD